MTIHRVFTDKTAYPLTISNANVTVVTWGNYAKFLTRIVGTGVSVYTGEFVRSQEQKDTAARQKHYCVCPDGYSGPSCENVLDLPMSSNIFTDPSRRPAMGIMLAFLASVITALFLRSRKRRRKQLSHHNGNDPPPFRIYTNVV